MNADYLIFYDSKTSSQQIYLYQQKIGSALYTATIIRSDVAKSVFKLSEFLQNSFPHHLAAIDQVISYLYGIKILAIQYSAKTFEQHVFICASDAAFGDDITT